MRRPSPSSAPQTRPPLGQQAAQRHAFADVDAARAVQRAEVVGGGRRGHALQDARRGLEQRHLQALAGRHGRGLQADVAAADHQQPLPGHQVRRHRVGVGQAAHHQHALQIAADVGRQAARPCTRQQHQLAVVDVAAVGQSDAAGRTVDAGDTRAQAQRDLLFLVPGRCTDQDLLHRQALGQVLLRQRRPVVGQHRLVTDQDQRAFISGAAHAVDESRGRVTTAHQHHRGWSIHRRVSCGPAYRGHRTGPDALHYNHSGVPRRRAPWIGESTHERLRRRCAIWCMLAACRPLRGSLSHRGLAPIVLVRSSIRLSRNTT